MRIGALSRLVVACDARGHGRRTGRPGVDAAFVCGNLISSRTPLDVAPFGRALVEFLDRNVR